EVARATALGPLEHEVLEQVAGPLLPLRLVGRSLTDPDPDGDRAHPRDLFGEHLHAVGQQVAVQRRNAEGGYGHGVSVPPRPAFRIPPARNRAGARVGQRPAPAGSGAPAPAPASSAMAALRESRSRPFS